jgi:hypothetical protein
MRYVEIGVWRLYALIHASCFIDRTAPLSTIIVHVCHVACVKCEIHKRHNFCAVGLYAPETRARASYVPLRDPSRSGRSADGPARGDGSLGLRTIAHVSTIGVQHAQLSVSTQLFKRLTLEKRDLLRSYKGPTSLRLTVYPDMCYDLCGPRPAAAAGPPAAPPQPRRPPIPL